MSAPADLRRAVAIHEAAHAVLASVTEQSWRYVTLRPRNPRSYGHVVFRDGRSVDDVWENHVPIAFAGIIAEDLVFGGPSGGSDLMRRRLVRDHGRADLAEARDMVRHAWTRNRQDPAWCATLIYPEWSATDLAIHLWEQAVWLAISWSVAIAEVGERLLVSPRAITAAEVNAVVDAVDPDTVDLPLPEHWARPWFLDHTRLQWEPKAVAA